ncbi:MAG: sigma-70 family polymerase sigma factor [Rhodoglobus sp.]|nr:sigma-70 family polymerase sigma factor [Rhodoglobus sp.]
MPEHCRRIRTVTATREHMSGINEREAFTQLAVQHSPALLGYISRRVGSVDSAPEILNDTLLIAWRRRARLPAEPERARMWLFVTARNCIRNHQRSSSRRRAHESPLDSLTEHIVANDDESAAEVRSVVLALPARYRELVMLIHWDGFSIAAAGEVLGLSSSTARTRYARARERLRIALSSRG